MKRIEVGYRKLTSAWVVWFTIILLFVGKTLFIKEISKEEIKLFLDFSKWLWGLYFGANVTSKLVGKLNIKLDKNGGSDKE